MNFILNANENDYLKIIVTTRIFGFRIIIEKWIKDNYGQSWCYYDDRGYRRSIYIARFSDHEGIICWSPSDHDENFLPISEIEKLILKIKKNIAFI